MRTFVSGQSGVAVLIEGSHCYVVRAPDCTRSQSRLSSALRLLDGSTDVEEIGDTDLQTIRLKLERACGRDIALQYTLVLLSEGEISDLEQQILVRLQDLLFSDDAREFILNRLFAGPLTSVATERAEALIGRYQQHPLSGILEDVLANQAKIARIRSAWELISSDRFHSVQQKDEFFLSAVENGLARQIAQQPQEFFLNASEKREETKLILRSWAKAAGAKPRFDYRHSPTRGSAERRVRTA